jgi:putative transcriptional regulator
LRRRNLKAKSGDVGEHEGGICAAACASEGGDEQGGAPQIVAGDPRFEGRSTEHDGVSLELARALTAATAAGRWELAERIMVEIEARRVVYPAGSPAMQETRMPPEPKEPIDDPPELTRENFERMLRGDQRERIIAGRLEPGDVAALRRFVGLTQEQFAEALGISMRTLQNWEQDRVKPDGPGLALIRIVARDPHVIGRISRS